MSGTVCNGKAVDLEGGDSCILHVRQSDKARKESVWVVVIASGETKVFIQSIYGALDNL